jgi:hypothetical protein
MHVIIGSMSSASSLFARSLALACAAIVALSGCTGTDPKPSISATHSTKVTAPPIATPTPSTVPTQRTTPTPAPTPTTTKPAPAKLPPVLPKLNATASISIAAVDRNTGELVVGGYVTGVFEDGGDCAFSVTGSAGGTPILVHTTGVANVDSTSCGSTSIPKSQLKAGTYTVALTYTNGGGTASSSSVTVKVAS